MATCRDVIKRALRKTGALGKSANPSAADIEMGMSALQSLFDGWVTGGKFGRLREVYKDSAYIAHAGERVRSSAPVTLPTYTDPTQGCAYDYGFAGCDEDGPRNRALIVVVNPATGVQQVNMWDATKGAWDRLDALAAGAECPLSNLGVDDLASCLARLMADETGYPVGAQTERRASYFERRLTSRSDSESGPAEALYF